MAHVAYILLGQTHRILVLLHSPVRVAHGYTGPDQACSLWCRTAQRPEPMPSFGMERRGLRMQRVSSQPGFR